MRPVVFSASSLNTYLECRLQWWFAYVAMAQVEQTEPQRVGIAIHDYAEQILRGKEEAELDDGLPLRTLLPLFDIFDHDILPTYRRAILVEAPFQLTINGIGFSGIIDSVDEHHYEPPPEIDWDSEGRDAIDPYAHEMDIRILRDLKSTSSRPRKGRYRLNMTGYWLGATDLLGREPDAAQLDWIVRTKKPYYWPEVLDPIDDDDIIELAHSLEVAAEGVARGDYRPTGLDHGWACKACPYAAICGPYQEVNGAN